MINSFWWGHGNATSRGINWMFREKLSMHKNYGSMDLKDLWAFNLEMLGKQGWTFRTKPQSLVSSIFKARYFPNNSYLTAKLGHNPSYVCRSILRAQLLMAV